MKTYVKWSPSASLPASVKVTLRGKVPLVVEAVRLAVGGWFGGLLLEDLGGAVEVVLAVVEGGGEAEVLMDWCCGGKTVGELLWLKADVVEEVPEVLLPAQPERARTMRRKKAAQQCIAGLCHCLFKTVPAVRPKRGRAIVLFKA